MTLNVTFEMSANIIHFAGSSDRKQCLLEALIRDPALLYHTDSHSV